MAILININFLWLKKEDPHKNVATKRNLFYSPFTFDRILVILLLFLMLLNFDEVGVQVH